MSDPRKANLRTMQMSSQNLKDVRDTQMLKGEAKRTKAEGESNTVIEYHSKNIPKGDLGGENKGN